MIGNTYSPSFTDWLFDEVERISYESYGSAPTTIPTLTLPDEEFPQPNNDASPSRRDLRIPSSSARANAAPYPAPNRIVDQINRSLERPKQDIKHSIPDLPNVPTGPRASAAGPIRRGPRLNGHTHRAPQQPPVPVLPQDFAAFASANGVPPQLLQQMLFDAANFQQMVQHSVFPQAPVTFANPISSPGMTVDGNSPQGRRRCRHWPRCNLGARCLFLHPSQICPDFPNCPNVGGTCLKIHVGEDIPESEVQAVVRQQLTTGRPGNSKSPAPPPLVPETDGHLPKRENQNPHVQTPNDGEPVPLCKFAGECTKSDCPYAHPSPAAGPEGLVLRGEMCPEGRDCLNKEVDIPSQPHPSLQSPPFPILKTVSEANVAYVVRVGPSKPCNRGHETERNRNV